MQTRVWHQHYPPGVPISLEYPAIAAHQLLQAAASRHPRRAALIFFDHTISYAGLNALVDRLATGLQRLGLRRGDRAAVYMPNCPQLVMAYYAIWRAGGIVVPVNPLYVGREVEHQVGDAATSVVLCLSSAYPTIKDIRPHTHLEHVIVTDLQEYSSARSLAQARGPGEAPPRIKDAGVYWLQDVLGAAGSRPAGVELTPEDTAVLMYTGGTTGTPKGAQLSHRNVVVNALQMAAWLQHHLIEGGEVTLSVLPLTHSYAMTVSMNQSIYRGFAQVLVPDPRRFDELVGAIRQHRPTFFPGVPSLYTAINRHAAAGTGALDVRSIKVCISGAAPLPPEVQAEFQRISGGRLVEGYGLTEASPVTHCNPVDEGGQIGSIGLPLPDTDCKIVDIDREIELVPPGQPGVLCVSGPQVMQAYWGMPGETDSVLRRERSGRIWLHTGDVATMSEDGYFRIVDRKKDTILTAGGYSVYPREIEDVLYEFPKVMEAAVIGVPVGGPDQRAKAFVVLRPGEEATQSEIEEFCRQRLAPFKVPRRIEFRSELPKSPVGKILRRRLMEEEASRRPDPW
jgi:long-chain acyl-CoA synthetase